MEITSPFMSSYFSMISEFLSRYVTGAWLFPLSLLLSLVVFLIALSIIIIAFSYFFSWMERKVVARAHGRHGPTYVGPFGFFQNLADFIKLLSKESIVPFTADRMFPFILPVMFGLFVVIMAFIPFTPAFVGINTTLALLAVFVLLSFSPLLMFLIGWTSGNKFSSISAQRSVIILISYEIPMFLVVLAVAMMAGSFSFGSIVQSQQSNGWLIALMPIGLAVFFIVLLAELERPPFDLRDADSELIAGWLVEVSAPYYLISLMLDYTRVLVGSLLVSIMFLGGWLGPAPIPPFIWLMVKVALLTVFIMVVRATTVRMRMDRVLRLGWAYLTPLAVANLLITYILFVI